MSARIIRKSPTCYGGVYDVLCGENKNLPTCTRPVLFSFFSLRRRVVFSRCDNIDDGGWLIREKGRDTAVDKEIGCVEPDSLFTAFYFFQLRIGLQINSREVNDGRKVERVCRFSGVMEFRVETG